MKSTNKIVANALAKNTNATTNASPEAMQEYRRLVGAAKKYLPAFENAVAALTRMEREADDASCLTFGEGTKAKKALSAIISWCRETSRMTPDDFDD